MEKYDPCCLNLLNRYARKIDERLSELYFNYQRVDPRQYDLNRRLLSEMSLCSVVNGLEIPGYKVAYLRAYVRGRNGNLQLADSSHQVLRSEDGHVCCLTMGQFVETKSDVRGSRMGKLMSVNFRTPLVQIDQLSTEVYAVTGSVQAINYCFHDILNFEEL